VKVLLTGASSFTGYWFARELAAVGHVVVAPLRAVRDSYSGVRGERVQRLAEIAEIKWACPFGEGDFVALAAKGGFDLLCHHAARVTNYRSPDFDIYAALFENTKSLPTLLRAMRENGLKGMILTGSVFEAEEGAGSLPLRAFSPYGVSKGITASLVRYWCRELGVPLGKFVIPHPFGPYEEPRFYAHLVKEWRSGKVAGVRSPRYVRDNIHVSLLAKTYASFAKATAGGSEFARLNPSGYVETQGAFTYRFSQEIGRRLGIECKIDLVEQTDFSEPLVRINTEPVDGARFGWSEAQAWDELAAYYQEHSLS